MLHINDYDARLTQTSPHTDQHLHRSAVLHTQDDLGLAPVFTSLSLTQTRPEGPRRRPVDVFLFFVPSGGHTTP